jgi:3-deoxy-7-phosphoheptulonate synthase
MKATLVSRDGWYSASWRSRPARQMPAYADQDLMRAVEARLSAVAPVVDTRDSILLRSKMAEVAAGRGFLLLGGDCAESFDYPVA